MPDMQEDNFCSTFYISELQYNSIENKFGIDIFECWSFRPISHLCHLFFKNILKFKLYERKFISISTVDLRKVLDDNIKTKFWSKNSISIGMENRYQVIIGSVYQKINIQ